MNIWALNKDNAIKQLLLALAECIGADTFALTQRWTDDGKAVGIYTPGEDDLVAYVYTHGQNPGKYGLHLEYPGLEGSTEAALTEHGENIGLVQLIQLLRVHFNR
jgi:hypothetical protein